MKDEVSTEQEEFTSETLEHALNELEDKGVIPVRMLDDLAPYSGATVEIKHVPAETVASIVLNGKSHSVHQQGREKKFSSSTHAFRYFLEQGFTEFQVDTVTGA